MFGKLKQKLKDAANIFSKEAEEAEEKPIEEKVEEKKTKEEKKQEKKEKKAEKKEKKKAAKEEELIEEKPEEKEEAEGNEEEQDEPKKKSFFGKIKESVSTVKLSEEKFEEIFWELEIGLLENDVSVEVIEKIKADMRELLTKDRLKRGREEEQILEQLKESIDELFVPSFDLLNKTKEKKPLVICMIGINGSGKTTTMAKLANYFEKNGKKCVLAAADTFRAAAIQQAQHHAEKLKIPIIAHDYGADPAAVGFDAIKYAKAKNLDVVFIDTAGRLHSNTNLMAELQKVIRVCNPDLKIFIAESITGNDAVEQSKQFNNAVGIDGIILTKADVDEKGGAAISTSYVTGKPILFLGIGQGYDDLKPFKKELIMDNLF